MESRLTFLKESTKTNKHGDKFAWYKCSCGTEKEIRKHNVKYKIVRSCGCLNKERMSGCKKPHLKGMTFGRLTVLEWAGMKRNLRQGNASWLCKCSCGTKRVFLESNLLSGMSKSCGCALKEKNRATNLKHGQSKKRIYTYWNYLKNSGSLPPEWEVFDQFYSDVNESMPEKKAFLHKLDVEKPLGKNNFYWSIERFRDNPTFVYEIDDKKYTRRDVAKLLGVSRQCVNHLDKQGRLVARVLMALDGYPHGLTKGA